MTKRLETEIWGNEHALVLSTTDHAYVFHTDKPCEIREVQLLVDGEDATEYEVVFRAARYSRHKRGVQPGVAA